MPVTLDETTRRLLDGQNFATVATVNPDGSPQSSVVWVKRDGDAVLFSTLARRRKARNLARDPRVSVMIFDTANPYQYAEIRGTAELIEDPTKALSKELWHKYRAQDPPPEPAEAVRLIIRVTPEKVVTYPAS